MNPLIHGKPKGFTIIEFLVASVLAMIVIMAAGSTYFMTRKLGDSAQKRLAIQQNLRNATTQIVRDARMAGSFGCYNTSSTLEGRHAPKFKNPNLALNNNDLVLSDEGDDLYGIRQINIGVGGTNYPALAFIYGLVDTGITKVTTNTGVLSNVDSNILSQITLANNTHADLDPLRQALAQKGNLVLSSCRAAYGIRLPQAITGNTVPLNLETTFRDADIGELTLSQLYATAYLVDNNKRLLRLETNAEGKWVNPQLVAAGINSMSTSFGYAKDCQLDKLSVAAASGTAATPETFTFRNTLASQNSSVTKFKQLPAMVQIRLNYDLHTESSNNTNNPATASSGTADYVINATVRGGNTCGSRTPSSS